MKYIQRLFVNLFRMVLVFLILGTIIACYGFFYIKYKLPNVDVLNDIQLQVPMKIYTSDGKLIGEFGEKRRIPVKLDQVPILLQEAVLATEDQRFYEHAGVDFIGLMRAVKQLVMTGKKEQGASTITMQVARNFFLSRKKTYTRKINEILLALMIDHQFSKKKILELYLNKIYLGNRAYGVAAAAKVYYDKDLDQLTLPQIAMIAGLAQAPSLNNPISNPETALKRRNHVLSRMLDHHYIDKATYENAIAAPITASYHGTKIEAEAPYIAEMVRQAMFDKYGEKAYTEGFKVYTTINSQIQDMARGALQTGLLAYDRRHRGSFFVPKTNYGKPTPNNIKYWSRHLQNIPSIGQFKPAVILSSENNSSKALLAGGDIVDVTWKGVNTSSKILQKIFKPGNFVRIMEDKNGSWRLVKLPEVEGALVSINPQNGAIIAIVGGFDYNKSKFNRATQGELQPGSNCKPFI